MRRNLKESTNRVLGDRRLYQDALLQYVQPLLRLLSDPALAPDAMDVWVDWFIDPRNVSDQSLSRILPIEESTRQSTPSTPGVVCYFRSFNLSVTEFRRVRESLKGAVIMPDVIRGTEYAGSARVFIRYVGTTEDESPWKRAARTNIRFNSPLGHFITVLKRDFPEVWRGQKIYKIKESLVSMQFLGFNFDLAECARLGDDLERSMISFFDQRTLLNLQAGGKQLQVAPDDECLLILLRCQTGVQRYLSHAPAIVNKDLMKKIQKELSLWFRYARQNKIWGDKVHPHPSYLISVRRQASPLQVHGEALWAICGRDPPWDTITNASSFLSGQSKASRFVKDIILSFSRIENDTYDVSIKLLESITGFSQLFAWPELQDKAKERSQVSLLRLSILVSYITLARLCQALLDSWLVELRPLIVVALGSDVTGWLRPTGKRTRLR